VEDSIQPIKTFGVVLMGVAMGGAFFFLFLTSPAPFFDPRSPSTHERAAFYLITAVLIAYFLTGLGVALLRKWAYFPFKLFLYVMFLVFPIGTIISCLTLSYMRRHNIRKYFGFPAP
jgi:hypothetical protein